MSRSKSTSASRWNEMIEEFRALGGTAENVVLGSGTLGRGLFPVDPQRPIRIAVPDNLLISVSDLTFDNGALQVKRQAPIGARERAFFNSFQADFSWGGGGKSDCEAFFERMDALPENVKEALSGLGLAGIGTSMEGDRRTQSRFIGSRMIAYGKGHVLMPVLELVNHGVSGCPFSFEPGISIDGTFETEVLAHYGMVDPYGAFEMWGFASNEPVAFSLPATMTLDSRRLVIRRQLSKKAIRGNFRIPVLEKDETAVSISHMMLGHESFPRLSKGVFYQFMRELGDHDAEALFDRIRSFNIQQFLKLMRSLEDHQGPLISTLRQLCWHQISAITHSIGTRDI